MKYHHCRVKHDPEANTFGDCLRACVASMLDVDDPLDVPHFFSDNCDAETGYERLRLWLAARELAPFFVGLAGDMSFEEVLHTIGSGVNYRVVYVVFGRVSENHEDHALVCRGTEIEHDPSWTPGRFTLPCAGCDWQVMLIVANKG